MFIYLNFIIFLITNTTQDRNMTTLSQSEMTEIKKEMMALGMDEDGNLLPNAGGDITEETSKENKKDRTDININKVKNNPMI